MGKFRMMQRTTACSGCGWVLMLSGLAAALPSITAPGIALKDGDTYNIPFDADGNPNIQKRSSGKSVPQPRSA